MKSFASEDDWDGEGSAALSNSSYERALNELIVFTMNWENEASPGDLLMCRRMNTVSAIFEWWYGTNKLSVILISRPPLHKSMGNEHRPGDGGRRGGAGWLSRTLGLAYQLMRTWTGRGSKMVKKSIEGCPIILLITLRWWRPSALIDGFQ
jgi:hypothetical protein